MEPQIIDYYKVRSGPLKSTKIKSWINQGMVSDDWDKTYNRWLKTMYCEKCNCKLVRAPHPRCKMTAVIDHDHSICAPYHNIRNILCMSCNSKRQ